MSMTDYELKRFLFQYNNFRYIQGDGNQGHDPRGKRVEMEDRTNYCLNYFSPKTHLRGISVGAGDGEEVQCFNEQGFLCMGATMSKRNIDEAQERYNVKLIYGDMHFLPLRAACFDFVFSSHSFEHSIFPLFAAIEWARILRQGGYLFIEYPDISAPQEQRAMNLHHVSNMSSHYVIHLFKKCGMSLADFTQFGWPNCPEWTMNRFMFLKEGPPCDDIIRLLTIDRTKQDA